MLPLFLLGGGAVVVSRLVREHLQRSQDPVSAAVETLSPTELARFSTSRIHAIETLGKENDVEARRLLARLALDVEPLMRKHNLEVTALLEMSPAAPHSALALRHYAHQSRFHSYDTLLGVVLRGLAFNTHPDQSPDFWRLVGRYEQEMEEIKRNRAACQRRQDPVQSSELEDRRWASFGVLGAVLRRLDVAIDLTLGR